MFVTIIRLRVGQTLPAEYVTRDDYVFTASLCSAPVLKLTDCTSNM